LQRLLAHNILIQVPVLEKAGYEKAESNDEGAPPQQHADAFDGAIKSTQVIKSQVFMDFLHGVVPPSPLM
jgi:hypothetical protein